MSDTLEKTPEQPVAESPAIEQPVAAPVEASVVEKSAEQIAAEDLKAKQEKEAAAQKAAQEKLDARIAELKTYAGKHFERLDGKELRTKIIRYDGTRQHQEMRDGKPVAINSHVFLVEASDGRRWTPPATQFLAEHKEVQVEAKTESTNEPI